MTQNSFLGIIEQSIRNNWDLPAMTDYEGRTLYYKDFAREIDQLHDVFNAAGIQRGDKISLCGRNSSNWAIVFFATLSYGAVSVNILNEFDKGSVQFIVDHSDSKVLFTDESIWAGIDESTIPKAETVFSLDNFSVLKTSSDKLKQFMSEAPEYFSNKYKRGFFVNDINFRTDKPEELAIINYTSGTTSSPKGVMLPYRSLWSNTKYANENVNFMQPGDNIVCMLPMAHTYGLAFEILNSISLGCHIHFLGKTPSPKILKDAFAKTKPKLVLAVPLILEKIVTKVVFPKLKTGSAATLKKIPLLNYIVFSKVRKSMIEFFGGQLDEVVIGGAALNHDVENFLKKIKFPFTVGYGMTECGPLISYAYWKDYKKRSSGKVVDRMQVKIDSKDPENIVGEIMTKGSNLMLGYYKNEEATKEAFTSDGWFKTGDIGTIDKDNFIFIKGRNKNVLLGPSGQNIYPEEIEEKLSSSDYISEVLVIGENHKIIALIVPDSDSLKSEGITEEKWNALFTKIINEVNSTLPSYSRIASFRIQEEEFDKTPKRSIRRFKYQK
ncbi:MAG: AMP-binding protein [Fermentimonas sp.]|nr:AMP-binding protein [Fermentimonas sp.]